MNQTTINNNQPINLDYFYGIQSEMFSFLKIPKILIKDGRFEHLSNEAKMLFGLLLDRMSLSVKNRWFDSEDRVYIIYTVDEIMVDLCIGTGKCVKLLKELEEYGLITRKKQGISKPDIIYVKNFATLVNDGGKQPKEAESKVKNWRGRNKSNSDKTQDDTTNSDVHNSTLFRKSQHEDFENRNTTVSQIATPEFRKSQRNKTDINNTDYIYTDNNSLTHSLTNENEIVSEDNPDSTQGVREGETDDIYTIIDKAVECQTFNLEYSKFIQDKSREELKSIPRFNEMFTKHLTAIHAQAEYNNRLTLHFFMESAKKHKWTPVETMEMAKKVLKLRVGYEFLCTSKEIEYYEDEVMNTLINLMAETIGFAKTTVIGGVKYMADYMNEKFFELDQELFLHVIKSLRTSGSEIRNRRSYYISCLLNAKDHFVAEMYDDLKSVPV